MAVVLDATAQSFVSSAQTLTYSHVCTNAVAITKLIVHVYLAGGGTVSTVTYGGVGMTGTVGGMYYLDNPLTGANNVVVTCTTPGVNIFGSSVSYTGCAALIDNSTSGTTSANVFSLALTPSVDNCWLVFGAGVAAVSTVTSNNGNTTVRLTQTNASNASSSLSDTNGAITPAASTTLSVQASGGTPAWTGDLISVSPVIPIAYTTSPADTQGSTDVVGGLVSSATFPSDTVGSTDGIGSGGVTVLKGWHNKPKLSQ